MDELKYQLVVTLFYLTSKSTCLFTYKISLYHGSIASCQLLSRAMSYILF